MPVIKWNPEKIREAILKHFSKRACWFQIKVAEALYAKKDVVGIAPTGSGKTLSFFGGLVMAMEEDPMGGHMVIIASPLSLLSKQNVEMLLAANISAIALTAENNNEQTFQEIARLQYRVIFVSPEILMQNDAVKGFANLWKKPQFTNKILYFVFDEGHCISKWSSFRQEYLTIGTLRFLIPDRIPFFVASGTLPNPVRLDVSDILQLRQNEIEYITLSCDRPNIHLVARPIQYPINSFKDLAFLAPKDYCEGITPPPDSFLVFFDSTTVTEQALLALRAEMAPELHDKVAYFHAGMSQAYREEKYQALKDGILWGLFVTIAFGMGMDLPHVRLAIQWRATCDMCDLWQRFGRVARATGAEGTGLLFYEKSHLDETRERKRLALEATQSKKQKAQDDGGCASKRRLVAGTGTSSAPSGASLGQPQTPSDATDPESIGQAQIAERKKERSVRYARRAPQNKPLKEKVKGGAGDDRPELDVYGPIDDFINAKTRSEIGCRHVPVKLYLDGPTRIEAVHLQCDTSKPSGCTRCAPHSSDLCCDICNPEHFQSLFISPTPIKSTRVPNRSSVKTYSATRMDKDLKEALRVWRHEQAVSVLGKFKVRKWGVLLFMSDETVQRIVDCVHIAKISTIEHIAKETRWRRDYLDRCAVSLLALIEAHSPQPPPPPPPPPAVAARASRVLNALAVTEQNIGAPAKRAPRCSACKALGHTKRSENCPAKLSVPAPLPLLSNNENEAPSNRASSSTSAPPSATTASYQSVLDFSTTTAPPTPARGHTHATMVPVAYSPAFNRALQSNPMSYSSPRAPPPY
ncbi:hypothetical protein HWV62_34599 [Athelia sp. TMB]|nr:hypothetical protein HWV62_34599 [Athelia sp. TMB]